MTGEPSFHDSQDRRGVWVPLWVVDAVDGDWPVALLYSQLLWWHQPGLDGTNRARHRRDGEVWLLRADDEWVEECRLTLRQVRRARTILVDLGLVECRRFKREGAPVSAWRPIRPEGEVTPEGHFHGGDAPASVGSDAGASVPPIPDRSKGELQTGDGASGEAPGTEVAHLDASPEVIALCELLADKMQAHREMDARPTITKAWTKAMRLLLERGPLHQEGAHPLDAAKVRASIEFLFTELATPEGRGGFCWADQVRSPQALRDHWLQLRDAARRKSAQATGATRGPSKTEAALAANPEAAKVWADHLARRTSTDPTVTTTTARELTP